MFKGLSTLTKFIILSVILFIFLVVVLIFASRLIIQNAFTDRVITRVNSDINQESKNLRPEDFSQKDPQRTKDIFNKLFEKIKTEEIVRIKVWDYSAKVIFSDDHSLVGQRFPDNEGFQNSIKGKLFSDIETPSKAENVSEKNYDQLLEVYVPIIFNGESIPSGVIEVYFRLNIVNSQIAQTQIILIFAGASFAVFAFILFLILFKMVIYKQLEQINLQATALDAAANGIVITDLKGNISWVNQAFTQMTGYTFDEAVGQSTRILNSGKQDKLFYKNLWDTILAGKIWQGEMIDRRKDGSLYPEEQIITQVKDGRGRTTHFISIKQDISGRKKTEEIIETRAKQLESLTKSQEETKKAMLNVMEDLQAAKTTIEFEKVKDEAILASIGDGLVAIDEKGQVIHINQVGCDLLGFKSEELLGKKFVEVVGMVDENGHIIPKDQRPTQMSLTRSKSTTTTTTRSIYHYIRKDKTQFPVGITVTPVTLNNKITGVIEVFRDITQDKEVDKAKTEFVSLASHQLRTPLTSINWYIEMLQSGDAGVLNDKQKEYFLEIYKGSRHMVELLNDLLNVSRLETGRLKIEPVPTDLKAFIQEVCKELEPLVLEMGCQLSLKLPERIEKVNVDQVLLRQVIINLLINAIQYSSVGKAGQVTVSLDVSPKEYVISVKDNGIGIPKEVQGRIFEKFFRADNAQQIMADGNGLGLYLVKQILDSSGGSIRFDSQSGKGSTFYVTIPLSGMNSKEGQKGLEK